MSTTTAALTIAVVLAIALPAAWWQIRRAAAQADHLIAEAHEHAALARDVDDLELAWAMPAYDAELDAGCERLRQAIRDEQQKGEQA